MTANDSTNQPVRSEVAQGHMAYTDEGTASKAAGEAFRSCVWNSTIYIPRGQLQVFKNKDGMSSNESRNIHVVHGDTITVTNFLAEDKSGKNQEYRMWEISGKANFQILYSIKIDGEGERANFSTTPEDYRRVAPTFENVKADFEKLPPCKNAGK